MISFTIHFFEFENGEILEAYSDRLSAEQKRQIKEMAEGSRGIISYSQDQILTSELEIYE